MATVYAYQKWKSLLVLNSLIIPEKQKLFLDVIDDLTSWTNNNKQLSTIEIEKYQLKYE